MDDSLQPPLHTEHSHHRKHIGKCDRLWNAVSCPIRRGHNVCRWVAFLQESCPVREGNGGAGHERGARGPIGWVHYWNLDPLPAVGLGWIGDCGIREQTFAWSTCYICGGSSQAVSRFEETDTSRRDQD